MNDISIVAHSKHLNKIFIEYDEYYTIGEDNRPVLNKLTEDTNIKEFEDSIIFESKEECLQFIHDKCLGGS